VRADLGTCFAIFDAASERDIAVRPRPARPRQLPPNPQKKDARMHERTRTAATQDLHALPPPALPRRAATVGWCVALCVFGRAPGSRMRPPQAFAHTHAHARAHTRTCTHTHAPQVFARVAIDDTHSTVVANGLRALHSLLRADSLLKALLVPEGACDEIERTAVGDEALVCTPPAMTEVEGGDGPTDAERCRADLVSGLLRMDVLKRLGSAKTHSHTCVCVRVCARVRVCVCICLYICM
jgi:hypothetical protein